MSPGGVDIHLDHVAVHVFLLSLPDIETSNDNLFELITLTLLMVCLIILSSLQ